MTVTIARCGLACEICNNFNMECLGCENENSNNKRCVIFNCSTEKNIKYCLQCNEYPCRLMIGLSKSYCPIYSEIKLKKTKQLLDTQLILA